MPLFVVSAEEDINSHSAAEIPCLHDHILHEDINLRRHKTEGIREIVFEDVTVRLCIGIYPTLYIVGIATGMPPLGVISLVAQELC